VVFIGDSITDAGRRAHAAPLGDGYVRLVVGMITARYPQRNIRFLNEGISGNIAADLRDRWADDVLVHQPDWLSVMVGINDLHRCLFPQPGTPRYAVSPDEYRQVYRDCLQRTRRHTRARLVLMDPFYMSREGDGDSRRGQVLRALPEYIRAVTDLAAEFRAIHVPLHEAFRRQLRHRPTDFFGAEPVHPNPMGNLVIAEAFLAAVGC